MVITTTRNPDIKKWSLFFASSVLLNILLAFSINVNKNKQAYIDPTPIRINLKAIASPTLKPSEKKTAKKAEAAKPIITDEFAKKSVKMSNSSLQETVQKKPDTANARQDSRADKATISDNHGSDSSTVVSDAKYRRQVAPVYPRRSFELGQQGMVTLHAHINKSGYPELLKIVKSSGYSLLDKAALTAVKKWEFEPVNQNGLPIASWVKIPVEFVIQSN